MSEKLKEEAQLPEGYEWCDCTRRGVGRFIGMRPALPDEIPKES